MVYATEHPETKVKFVDRILHSVDFQLFHLKLWHFSSNAFVSYSDPGFCICVFMHCTICNEETWSAFGHFTNRRPLMRVKAIGFRK